MTNFNNINSPISREERNKLNENWQLLTQRFNHFQRHLNLLAGEDVEGVITNINERIAETDAALQQIETDLLEVNGAADNANAKAELAQTAADIAEQITELAQEKVDFIEEHEEDIVFFTSIQNNLQAQVNQLVISGDSSPEAAQARVGTDGTSHSTLKARLDSEIGQVAQQLAQTADSVVKAQLDDFEIFELNYPISPPNFPSIKPPFRLYRGLDNIIRHDVNFDDFEIGAGDIYVKGYYGGSDNNDGLSAEKPVSTLGNALAKANALPENTVVIHFLDNAYDDSRTSPYTFTLTKNIIFKSESSRGKTFYHTGVRPTSLAWVADGTAYTTSRNGVLQVFDTLIQDGDLPKEYVKLNSVAEVQATEGSWYTDGTSIWVHRIGGIIPDDNMALIMIKGVTVRFNIGDFKFITRGMEFYNETSSGDALAIHSTGTTGEYWNENCLFSRSKSRNGLAIMGVKNTFSFNSVARNNYLDGFNYHAPTISVDNRHYAFEFNCEGFDNGTADITNANGSTAHDGFAILRINGKYHDTHGPVIADVNSCFSVLYDCLAYNSLRPANPGKAAFYFDNSASAKEGVAYLINSAGGGEGTFSISTYGIPVYVRNHKGRSLNGTGKISVY